MMTEIESALFALPPGEYHLQITKKKFGDAPLKPEGSLVLRSEDRTVEVVIVPINSPFDTRA